MSRTAEYNARIKNVRQTLKEEQYELARITKYNPNAAQRIKEIHKAKIVLKRFRKSITTAENRIKTAEQKASKKEAGVIAGLQKKITDTEAFIAAKEKEISYSLQMSKTYEKTIAIYKNLIKELIHERDSKKIRRIKR